MRTFLLISLSLWIWAGPLPGQTGTVTNVELDLVPSGDKQMAFLPHEEIRRPKIGLALSGGGARGLAHIGILKALEQADVHIDMIAGTSMGAIIGGLYAAGYTPEELEEIARRIDWTDLFVDTPPRTDLFIGQKQEKAKHFLQVRFEGFKPHIPQGYTSGQKLSNLLTSLTLEANYRSRGDFDRLNIPFRTVTTDLVSGDKVILSEGDLGEALRASLTIPLLFTPVEKGDRLLADGGIVDYLPVNVVREMGADVVIAVNILNSLRSKEGLQAPWEVADQVISIIMMIANEKEIRNADISIEPDLRGHSSLVFENIDSLITWGEEACGEHIGRILDLSSYTNSTESADPSYRIRTMNIEGFEHLPSGMLDPAMSIKPGSTITKQDIRICIENIYRLGYFSNVRAEIQNDSLHEDSTLADLTIFLEENPEFRGIELSGNLMFPADSILSRIDSRVGLPVNHGIGKRDLREIVDFYHRKGYVLARIEQVSYDERNGFLKVNIDEGVISEIRVIGNDKAKDRVVTREFPLKAGRIFHLETANRGIQNIYSTGLFDRVHMSILPWSGPTVVELHVKENPSVLMRMGGRFDLEYESEGFVEFHEDNLLGNGSKLNLHIQYGRWRQIYRLNQRADRFLNTYLTYGISAYHLRREQYQYSRSSDAKFEYNEKRWGVRISIGQQIYRFGNVSIEGRAEEVKIRPDDGQNGPMQNEQIRSLTFRSVVDNLDRYPFPMGGNYSHLSLELAAVVLGGSASYVKFFGTWESYATFFKRHTLHPKLSFGSMDQITPYSERFRVGGNRAFCQYPGEEQTLRLYGYHDEEFVGRQLLWANLEYRYKTPWFPWLDIYLSGRYDVGYLWQEAEDFRSDNIMESWGLGIAFDLPIGPTEFHYGQSDTGTDRVYFSLGFWF